MTKTEQIDKAIDHLDMARVNLLALRAVFEVPDEQTSAERLEAIWNKLFDFMSTKRLGTLFLWASEHIGYKYYGGIQKGPVDLCEYIRDKLRSLDEKNLTELEAILE